VAPSCVDLIQGASWALVLSDVGTDAAGRTGELCAILEGSDTDDREPPRAMRPWQACLERKTFSLDFIFRAAELFTFGCGALIRTLLAEC
jgi:hypothetical protein